MHQTSEHDPETTRPLVAVTGAAGRVGRLTVPALAGRYRLRLVDLDFSDADAGADVPGDAELVTADLRDPAAWAGVVEAADVVVHLAADPSPQSGVAEVFRDVITPTAQLAAALPGSSVRRVVFASSIHAMGRWAQDSDTVVRPDWSARPCCAYGAGKVFGENLLGLAGRDAAVVVVSLRLGLTGADPTDEHSARQWLGPHDFQRLLLRSLTAEVTEGAWFAVSAPDSSYDVGPTRADLGFAPHDPVPDLGRDVQH